MAAAIGAGLPVSDATGPAATVDPGLPGPYAMTRRTYELPAVPWPEYAAPIEVLGEMTVPTGASGPRPVVVVLHGRHAACFRGGPTGDTAGANDNQVPVTLTSGELAVLKVLVSHPREALSRDKLMNLARGREYTATERSIDVQVSRLRRMLEADPAHPRPTPGRDRGSPRLPALADHGPKP